MSVLSSNACKQHGMTVIMVSWKPDHVCQMW